MVSRNAQIIVSMVIVAIAAVGIYFYITNALTLVGPSGDILNGAFAS